MDINERLSDEIIDSDGLTDTRCVSNRITHSSRGPARGTYGVSVSRNNACVERNAAFLSETSPSPVTSSEGKRKMDYSKKASRKSVENGFPKKLMEVLSRDDISHIICWLPHGRSFTISDRRKFEEEVLPLYFQKCKFMSFVRKLYRWGFRQITKGADADSYFHELFQRDQKSLYKHITHNRSKSTDNTTTTRDVVSSERRRDILEHQNSTKSSSSDESSGNEDDKERMFKKDPISPVANMHTYPAVDSKTQPVQEIVPSARIEKQQEPHHPANVTADGTSGAAHLLSRLSLPSIHQAGHHPNLTNHQLMAALSIGQQQQEIIDLNARLMYQRALLATTPGNVLGANAMLNHPSYKNPQATAATAGYGDNSSLHRTASLPLTEISALINGNDGIQQEISKMKMIQAIMSNLCRT